MNLLNRVQQLEFDTGAAWLFRAGRTGIICGLVGHGFYDEIGRRGVELMKEQGLDRLIVEIQDWHLRMIKIKLKGFEIEERCKFIDNGTEFIECELRIR